MRSAAAFALFLATALLGSGAEAATVIEGSFALAGGTQTVGGRLTATTAGQATDLKLDVTFHRTKEDKLLKKFETEAGDQMEIVVVSADFSVFTHYRLPHVIDGHGQERVHFPADGLYHVYVAATPQGLGRQILRFDLPVGEPSGTPSPAAPPSGLEADAGPYRLHADTLDLTATRPATILVAVAENDKPPANLRAPAGHGNATALAVDEQSLMLIPVKVSSVGDPPAASADAAGPRTARPLAPMMSLRLTPPAASHYRLWIEFLGGRMPYAAAFQATAHAPAAE